MIIMSKPKQIVVSAFSPGKLFPVAVPIIVSAVLLCVSASAVALEAYYTRMDGSPKNDAGRFVDLIVAFDKTNRFEFAGANGYLPQWRTAGGIHRVENIYSDREADTNCYYSYVQLLENGPDQIVVHWRYFRDITALIRANAGLDSLNPHGITGVVHELFTIHPDGQVEREIRAADHTRYQDWIDPRLATRQTLKLTSNGIEHGPVRVGQKPPFLPRPAVKGSLVKERKGLPALAYRWTFDDGLKPHDDKVKESVTGTGCEITGLMTQFKKGLSGTALALDGYYGGVSMEATPATTEAVTVEAWVALDAYPYNTAPLVHHSKGFGIEGWYLGLDAYGHPLVTVSGHTLKAVDTVLPLYRWAHVCAAISNRRVCLYVDGREVASEDYDTVVMTPSTPLLIGRNNEPMRCTDTVRGPRRNLEFVYGIQGLLDEVRVYSVTLSAEQVKQAYDGMRPADTASDLAWGVLPGKTGKVSHFGASYKTLSFSDVWDQLWREVPGTEIVVNFDNSPCSVIYWRGANYAPSWVTDNNRWMADQSSETGGPHGCSEHMSDKQVRHCRARIIENTPARVMIHWRYPCVDVSYQNIKAEAWSDEYHTIYPDGTGVRQVAWNGNRKPPGFQDIQFLTNPGETALDVMNLQAMTLANLKGEVRELTWISTNGVPRNTLPDATIELMNSKSEYKVFAMLQGGRINPWGADEQSIYSSDPFAGPWSHWPMHLVPSDGRFAVATDRVTHFALGANEDPLAYGSMVFYGFTRQPIATLLPLAKSWIHPPEITAISGCRAMPYRKEARDYPLVAERETMVVRIDASEKNPIVNLCFSVRNWGHSGAARLKITGAVTKEIRQGTIVDTDGTRTMIIWIETTATLPVNVTISGAVCKSIGKTIEPALGQNEKVQNEQDE